jgi:hypothetical protein
MFVVLPVMWTLLDIAVTGGCVALLEGSFGGRRDERCGSGRSGARRTQEFDKQLYPIYSTDQFPTSIPFVICGPGGCYGSGGLGPFENAGAIMEGVPQTQGNVTTHPIFVLDRRMNRKDR